MTQTVSASHLNMSIHGNAHVPLNIINIDLSFHAASAAVVGRYAEVFGAAVTHSAAPHGHAFAELVKGAAYVLVSAWLPASHGKYIAPMKAKIIRVTRLYEPYCIWAVPDYILDFQVTAVANFLKPAIAEQMDKSIQGINPGAGISRFSAAMVEQYRLDKAGYRFQTGTEEGCFG